MITWNLQYASNLVIIFSISEYISIHHRPHAYMHIIRRTYALHSICMHIYLCICRYIYLYIYMNINVQSGIFEASFSQRASLEKQQRWGVQISERLASLSIIEGPPENPPYITQHYRIEGFKGLGALNWAPIMQRDARIFPSPPAQLQTPITFAQAHRAKYSNNRKYSKYSNNRIPEIVSTNTYKGKYFRCRWIYFWLFSNLKE